jgi:sodium-dependent dicarboxylate transporter 2/3/5
MKGYKKYNYKSLIGLVLGPVTFVLFLFFITPAGMNPQAQAVLACTLWIAIWWITEAIPIPATSLLPIVIFPLTDALNATFTASSYADNIIFLFLGGFIIAIAMERWDLHKRIAMNVISAVGTNGNKIILGFMGATAFLSMWISNTATAMMMLPIGIAVIKQLSDLYNRESNNNETNFGKALMLSIAYAASIGGMATLVGTPPNIVLAGVVTKTFDVQISFVQWLVFGLPVSLLLLATSWYFISNYA